MEPVTPGKEKGPKEKSSLDEMVGDSEGTLLVTGLLGQSSPQTPLVGCVLTGQRLTIHPSTTVPHNSSFIKQPSMCTTLGTFQISSHLIFLTTSCDLFLSPI